MSENRRQPIAIVGLGAILPDAPDVATFWRNLRNGRYSISEATPDRWDPADYFDADPRTPDKTYSKIGGWVRDWSWDPIAWRLPIPPRVAAQMDLTQKWAVAAARQALADYGYPARPLDPARTAVVIGNAMGGDRHYVTATRLLLPAYARELAQAPSFLALPAAQREAIAREFRAGVGASFPEITEDSMPGELSNIIAGRVANLFDFHGPNFVCDAACASAMAGISAAAAGLDEGEFDAVLTGGVDANMSPSTFIKFCKIGALSATGTRPFADGADGFVMGEGAALFLMKRLADAERDGDRVYAVLRGLGGASDGRGKGITAPNPVGQRLAVERGWENAGESPATVSFVEGHGTSTRVGDIAEVESLTAVFGGLGLAPASVPLGSVKSNIGHLKGAAGAAGILKAVLALHHRVLPPSLSCARPNPNIDFVRTPFHVPAAPVELRRADGAPLRGCVSAFGFGGTNFHAVLEEWQPGRLAADRRRRVAVGQSAASAAPATKPPLRGAVLLGAGDEPGLTAKVEALAAAAARGEAPPPLPPEAADLGAPLRLAIDFAAATDLAVKAGKAARALAAGQGGMWRALQAQGIYRGQGAAAKVAFLYTGQGSQYVNMLAELRRREPIVAETFDEADAVMSPLLGKPLSAIVFAPEDEPVRMAAAEAELRHTAITQPAVLTVDVALTRLLAAQGVEPDFVMGHSLGEYGALVAAGSLDFARALEAVSARGREMTRLAEGDPGRMLAVFAPLAAVEEVLAAVAGYAVIANINSTAQSVVGGESAAVERAAELLSARGFECRFLPVSHAFHTRIIAGASEPLKRLLARMELRPPRIPVVSNVTGDFYPTSGDAVPAMIDLVARQLAEPVQFVRGLETLYGAGAQVFVEVGPKRALQGFVADVLGHRRDVVSLSTNHPKAGDIASINHALCGLWAAGRGGARGHVALAAPPPASELSAPPPHAAPSFAAPPPARAGAAGRDPGQLLELGQLFAEFLERGLEVHRRGGGAPPPASGPEPRVVVTGAALGLPGTERVFDDANLGRLLSGHQLIQPVPDPIRREMAGKRITRLVKSDEGGGPRFEVIDSTADVIQLAARAGDLDLVRDFGLPADRAAACDRATLLAIGAGIDALRDAGLPLVLRYKSTTTGGRLPDRWVLPESERDATGVIFGSAFPGYDQMLGQVEAFHRDRARRERAAELRELRATGTGALADDLDRRLAAVEAELARESFAFDRRFLFQVLAMGHSQFAEAIGARGPNVQINSACATTTQAFALASDWIRTGRCRRVVVIAADDITSDRMLGWFGSGFLASGAAATDARVEDAALPFDRRRHGLLIGMGAAAAVLESAEAAAERGLAPICEVLGTVTANSAFHGSRLDVSHIGEVMERLVAEAEARWGIARAAIAPELVFVSHETYTPARGGSAQAEVDALRRVFGADAGRIVIANTKGYTGHPMGVGIEDVLAVKSLETGRVPPVPNLREPDPDLGALLLSRGGDYPIRYALRLGAGFGSQISMTLLRWVPTADGRRRPPEALGYAYRVVDPAAWSAWLERAVNAPAARLEVVSRTLRIADPGRAPALPSRPATTLAPVAAPAAPPAAAPAPPAIDEVSERVLALVAEKTGYPREMLALDLDLEADLGVDTVKQAEVFAAIREAWGIERDANLKLREFNTLAKTIAFVYDRRPDLRAPAATAVASAPPAAAPAATAPPAAGAVAADEVTESVLALVAEKTGYPREMLALDLDLEADLGVDTVKQAELFAAVRERYGIARDPDLKLREFNTLAKTIEFVHARRPDLRPGAVVEPPAPPAVAPDPALEESAAPPSGPPPRRVPALVLRPPLDFAVATGVTLAARDRVVVGCDQSSVAAALGHALAARGVVTLALDPALSGEEVEARLAGWLAEGPIRGLYWLPALDPMPGPGALDLAGWREALRQRVKLLAAALRALDGALAAPGAFLLAATRLGGGHGVDPAGAAEAGGGGVAGLVKALAREHEGLLAKVVDFETGAAPDAIAAALLLETEVDPGAVEIGHQRGERLALALAEAGEPESAGGLELGSDSVVVVTGAAGGIVSEIVAELARTGGTFHLLDLAPAPAPDDPDLDRLRADRDGLKRELFARLAARGDRATPVAVERELAGIERRAAALAALAAISANGGHAHYHQVDLRDGFAVAAALADVRAGGRVDLLVHAAGLEVSRRLADKPQPEFDLVFDVKADGWFNLLAGLGETPLGAVAVFSSIAGRFGNPGQTDYAAANELLAKSVSNLVRDRPGTRGLVLDWTGWAEIGMASRGSIPQLLAAAGVDLLPPAQGLPLLRRELAALSGYRELVVAYRLGALLAERGFETGVDRAALAAPLAAAGPMVDAVAGFGLQRGLVVTARLEPASEPFLDDHRIAGTPVLPGVMGIEAFAEAATLLFRDRPLLAVERIEFLAPFKFFRDEPREIEVECRFRPDGGELLAECRLFGRRQLPGQEVTQRTLHFAGLVRLGAPGAEPPRAIASDLAELARRAELTGAPALEADAIYRVYFHGPAYRVLAAVRRIDGLLLGEMPAALPPEARRATRCAPRAIELALQTAGAVDLGERGRLALPARLERVSFFGAPGEAAAGWRVQVRAGDGRGIACRVADGDGRVRILVEGYRTVDLPEPVDAERLAPWLALVEVGS